MAGHSKWANIKHRKAAQDQKKARLATQCIKDVMLAVREGGTASPVTNSKLRMAMQIAKANNITKDKIEQAIKKGLGAQKGRGEMIRYAGRLQQGAAFLLEAVTDNSNRTVAAIRAFLRKKGGYLVPMDSLRHLFVHQAIFSLSRDSIADLDESSIAWIEAGAEQIEEKDGSVWLQAKVASYGVLQELLLKQGARVTSASLAYIPLNKVALSEEVIKETVVLLRGLKDLGEVEKIYHNLAVELEL